MSVSKFLKCQAKGFFCRFSSGGDLKADNGKTMTPCGTDEQTLTATGLGKALPRNRLHFPELP